MTPTPEELDRLAEETWGNLPEHLLSYKLSAVQVIRSALDQVLAMQRRETDEPKCCEKYDIGGEYYGQRELLCCGNLQFSDKALLDWCERDNNSKDMGNYFEIRTGDGIGNLRERINQAIHNQGTVHDIKPKD